ncbi:MAG: 30S ribosomal protein S9 [Patescibacteria group bacterium]
MKADKYFEGIGRRKTAIARVRLTPGKGDMMVNGKEAKAYFPVSRFFEAACAPLRKLKMQGDFSVSAKVSGGGPAAQAGAVRHGLARALVIMNPELKVQLRGLGFMTRDSRMVERKKYGLKKARRAPQWQKR